MRRYQFNKLIRSKLPMRMIDEGVIINSTKLSKVEYIVQLKNKIIEEAEEVLLASSQENLKTELADVLEVIHALADVSGIKMQEIEEYRLEKLEVNGRFQANNYINYIEVEKDNHKVIEYLNNKDRPYKFSEN
jgi:predicted house-cleaning noncanonical NTP pyrophosphatase (MazG superfamily)